VVFRGAPTVYRRTFLTILGHQLHSLAFRCFSLVISVVPSWDLTFIQFNKHHYT